MSLLARLAITVLIGATRGLLGESHSRAGLTKTVTATETAWELVDTHPTTRV